MDKIKPSSKPAAQSYSPPTLKVYGSVQQLTASGSAGNDENTGNTGSNRLRP